MVIYSYKEIRKNGSKMKWRFSLKIRINNSKKKTLSVVSRNYSNEISFFDIFFLRNIN